MKAEVELREKSFAERADLFLKCITENQVTRARQLLEKEPELSQANFYTACAAGDLDYVKRALQQNPKLAVTSGGPDNALPLIYACCSGFLRDPQRAADVVAVVKQLLALGADPNSVFVSGPKHNSWRLSALYAAAGRANHAGVTRLLLEAGANPNDGESLYHSAEFKDLDCTRLLLEHGAKTQGSNAIHRKLDFDDLEGLRLFLDHGADPNLIGPSGNRPLHWAISNDRRVEFLELLADRGADLRARNREGLTPFRMASFLGHVAAVRFLTQRGAVDPLTPQEQFVAACARGDGPGAKALLQANPSLKPTIQKADHGLLTGPAWRGNTAVVRTMLELGFDVAARGRSGETALHNAAWKGHVAVVRELLKAGAPLEVKESSYNATPMGWALHGSVNARDSEGNPLAKDADYAGIVEALLQAGAKVSVDYLNGLKDDLPQNVQQVLKRAGLWD